MIESIAAPGVYNLHDSVIRLGFHDHAGLIYQSLAEKQHALALLIWSALNGAERCLCIVDQTDAIALPESLQKVGVNKEQAMAAGALLLLVDPEPFAQKRRWESEAVYRFIEKSHEDALHAGFSGLRMSADMTWLFNQLNGSSKQIEYAASVNRICKDRNIVILSAYDLDRLTPGDIRAIMHTHPLVIYRNTLCKNPCCVQTEEMPPGDEQAIAAKDVLDRLVYREQVQAIPSTDHLSGDGTLFRCIPAIMHSINTKGEIVDVSDFWLEKLGYRRDEVIGKISTDFLTPDSRQIAQAQALPEFFEKGFVRDFPYQFVKKSGEIIDVLLSANCQRDASGAILRSLAVATDVTERNKLCRQVQANEQRYRTMITDMLNGFALHEVICNQAGDPVDYRFLEVNRSFERMTGLNAKQILGKTVLEVLPKTENFWIQTYGQVALSQQPVHFENYSVSLKRHFEVLAFSPAPMQFAVVFTDISERKRTEIAIRHSEELFRRTFDQSPIGAAMVGLDYRFMRVNRELCRITGYDADELMAMGFPDITHAEDLDLDIQQARDLEQGLIDQYQMDKRYIGKNGKPVWIRLSVRLIRDNKGQPLYFLPMMEDIDARKRLEEENRVQLDLLRLINENADLAGMINAFLNYLHSRTAMDAVGLRLAQETDYPYFETRGFSAEFISQESRLCSMSANGLLLMDTKGRPVLECMCGLVINGHTDPSLPFFTDKGSFWTNSTTALLSQGSASSLPPGTRNRCNQAGYESVLLVPLRAGGRTLGLLQLNHKAKNRFTPEFISLMERLSEYISASLSQRFTEEDLKAKQVELQEVNAALKVLIRNRENDLLKHDRGLLINVRQLVMPCIHRLRLGSLSAQQKAQLNILESNLESITSPLARKLASPQVALTPALIQVADMIKKGLSNKEISALLSVSVKSIETYRKRIRQRLNLKNSKVNLRAYLVAVENKDN
jgi:PAS domain S-box-containing protein